MDDFLMSWQKCTYEDLCLFMERQINIESYLHKDLSADQLIDLLFLQYPIRGMIKPKHIYSLNPPKYDGIQVYTKDGWGDIVNDES